MLPKWSMWIKYQEWSLEQSSFCVICGESQEIFNLVALFSFAFLFFFPSSTRLGASHEMKPTIKSITGDKFLNVRHTILCARLSSGVSYLQIEISRWKISQIIISSELTADNLPSPIHPKPISRNTSTHECAIGNFRNVTWNSCKLSRVENSFNHNNFIWTFR
jgi:hypothetical protein